MSPTLRPVVCLFAFVAFALAAPCQAQGVRPDIGYAEEEEVLDEVPLCPDAVPPALETLYSQLDDRIAEMGRHLLEIDRIEAELNETERQFFHTRDFLLPLAITQGLDAGTEGIVRDLLLNASDCMYAAESAFPGFPRGSLEAALTQARAALAAARASMDACPHDAVAAADQLGLAALALARAESGWARIERAVEEAAACSALAASLVRLAQRLLRSFLFSGLASVS